MESKNILHQKRETKTRKDILHQKRETKTSEPDGSLDVECAICLEPCMQPIKLPCNHIFCFLCIKGITFNHHQHVCPMCRCEIEQKYVDNPSLIAVNLEHKNLKRPSSDNEQKFQWFYSGAKGWWEYDERTALDIDRAYDVFVSQKQMKKRRKKKPDKNVTNIGSDAYEIMIAGLIYIIDFQNMTQYQRDRPEKKRSIKREIRGSVMDCKGVAGLHKNNIFIATSSDIGRDANIKPTNVQKHNE